MGATTQIVHQGTLAEMLAFTPPEDRRRHYWDVISGTGQGDSYVWIGEWKADRSNGAALASDPAYTLIQYAGSGYTYLCEAVIGTARSTAAWRVSRITDATGDIVYAGTGLFEHAADDLATVAALTYTLEA